MKGADGGQACAGETGGHQVWGRPGEEKGGGEIKALQKRSIVPSGPAGLRGASRSARASTPPAPLRPPGPDSAAARGGPRPTSATAGPSAPRLPRPRLPPARPRARSPDHAAGHGPPPPGWGCTNEGRGRRRRPGGSASDTERTAHAGAARARAPCWTGGVGARLHVFAQTARDPPYNSTQSWAALVITKETANRNNEAVCFTYKTDKNVNILL